MRKNLPKCTECKIHIRPQENHTIYEVVIKVAFFSFFNFAFSLIFAVGAFGSLGYGAVPIHGPPPPPDSIVRQNPKPKTTLVEGLVKDDAKITKEVDEMASSIDVWLAGKRIVDTTNITKIIIRNQLNWPSGGPLAYNPLLTMRLHLPNLEKKWQLKFISYDETVERGIDRDRLRTRPISNDYGGSIGFFQKLGSVQFQFEPRVQFHGGIQVSYFASLTDTAEFPYFTIHPEAQFFAKSDSGVGQFFSSNVDIPIYKTLTFVLFDEEQYLDQLNVFSTNLGFGVTYLYNDKMSQGYTIIYEASNRPVYELTRYSVATTFTHKILKNVFQYIVQPYLAFSTPDFTLQPGINFEFDIIF